MSAQTRPDRARRQPHRITPRPAPRAEEPPEEQPEEQQPPSRWQRTKAFLTQGARKPIAWLAVIVVGAVATWSGTMIEKYLTKGFDMVGADIRVVDVNPMFKTHGSFVVAADTDLTSYNVPWLDISDQFKVFPGGTNVQNMVIQITLETDRSEPVNVTRIDPVLVDGGCVTPTGKGRGFVDNSPQGGGERADRFTTTISKERPTLDHYQYDGESASTTEPDYFNNGGLIKLQDGEAKILQVKVITVDKFCRFEFHVDYVAPNGRGSLTVDDHGEPFEITSRLPETEYDWSMMFPSYGCLTHDGRRAKLTSEQVRERNAIHQSEEGGIPAMQQYCAEVGVS